MALKRTTNDARHKPWRVRQELWRKRRTTGSFGKIGVLMGGPSSEREISLKSGSAVCQALKERGFRVVSIDIATDSGAENSRLLRSQKIDCAFIALHGRFGEDGQIQKILEELKIPYTCSGVLASKLAMDKIASRQIFASHGLHVPEYKVLETGRRNFQLNGAPNLPLVIKPAAHGSSIGLSIVKKEEGIPAAVEEAFRFDDKVVVEEYLKGRELTCGILNEQSLPVIEIIPKREFFDYEAKYQPGLTDYVVPARIEKDVAKRVQDAALSAHKLLGCYGCSRVDMILKDGLPYILEVNSIPGLTSNSLLPKAAKNAGIEFPDLCFKLIELAYEKK